MEKNENIHWLTLPDLPFSNQKEFMFQSHHDHDSNYHYEAYRKFAESIKSQLKQVHFVWHQELNSKEKQLQVTGSLNCPLILCKNNLLNWIATRNNY